MENQDDRRERERVYLPQNNKKTYKIILNIGYQQWQATEWAVFCDQWYQKLQRGREDKDRILFV